MYLGQITLLFDDDWIVAAKLRGFEFRVLGLELLQFLLFAAKIHHLHNKTWRNAIEE